MKTISAVLILILLAPVNLVAASAMQLESESVSVSEMAMVVWHAGTHAHEAAEAGSMDSRMQTMMESHDHSAEDCDEYCMSCSNHCSNTAIISGSQLTSYPGCRFTHTRGANLASRAYLLFRPPILS